MTIPSLLILLSACGAKPKVYRLNAVGAVNQLIVQVEPTDYEFWSQLQSFDARIVGELASINSLVVEANEVEALAERLAELRTVGFIERVVLNQPRLLTLSKPNDKKFAQQYMPQNIGADKLWKITTGSKKIAVAVFDTGVDLDHEDLVDNLWRNEGEMGLDQNGKDRASNGIDDDKNGFVDDWQGWDFGNDDNYPNDVHGHGTIVSGLIGARGNNKIGIAGVNWRLSIVPIKMFTNSFIGSEVMTIKGIEYVVKQKIRIANMSIGFSSYSRALYEALKYAARNDVLVVAAAGNSSENADDNPLYPAAYDLANVVSVAATSKKNKLAWFSNFGKTSVDLAAPGEKVLTTDLNNRYVLSDGTSEAAPVVAGAAALVLSAKPKLRSKQLKSALLGSVDRFDHLRGKVATSGRLNVYKAFLRR